MEENTKELFVDSSETLIRLRLFNPVRTDSETLSFSLGWVIEEHILSKSSGWRLKAGKINPPCRSTAKGYVPTSTLSGRLNNIMDLMLQEWRPHFKGIEFPSVEEKEDD